MARFSPLVLEAHENIQLCIAAGQDLIDSIDLTTSWAQTEPRTIEGRPMIIPMLQYLPIAVGLLQSPETKLGELLREQTKRQHDYAQLIIGQHRYAGTTLDEALRLLDSMAILFMDKSETLRREDLDRDSYWRQLLRRYSRTTRDFERLTALFAKFYRYLKAAKAFLADSKSSLRDIEIRTEHVRDSFDTAQNSSTASVHMLRRTVFSIEASTEHLDRMRTYARNQQDLRVETFLRALTRQQFRFED
jgi:hypothetical protein